MANELIRDDKPHFSLKEIREMADYVCSSGLFAGINTPEAAVTLMMLCQAENIHPMKAAQRYHIIKGKPSMKADSMLGEFQSKGGKVKWVTWNDEKCEAIFFAPGTVDGVTVDWTIERARQANITSNPTWRSYPRNMLRARVISDGIRMCMPAIIAGIYTPEEVVEFVDKKEKFSTTEYAQVGYNAKELIDILKYEIEECENLENLNKIGLEIKDYSEEVRNEIRKIYTEKIKQLKDQENELQTNE